MRRGIYLFFLGMFLSVYLESVSAKDFPVRVKGGLLGRPSCVPRDGRQVKDTVYWDGKKLAALDSPLEFLPGFHGYVKPDNDKLILILWQGPAKQLNGRHYLAEWHIIDGGLWVKNLEIIPMRITFDDETDSIPYPTGKDILERLAVFTGQQLHPLYGIKATWFNGLWKLSDVTDASAYNNREYYLKVRKGEILYADYYAIEPGSYESVTVLSDYLSSQIRDWDTLERDVTRNKESDIALLFNVLEDGKVEAVYRRDRKAYPELISLMEDLPPGSFSRRFSNDGPALLSQLILRITFYMEEKRVEVDLKFV